MSKKAREKVTLVSPDGGEYTPASRREETRLRARGYTVKKVKQTPAPAPRRGQAAAQVKEQKPAEAKK